MASWDDEGPGKEHLAVPEAHNAAIGKLARTWGFLEHLADQITWDLASVEQQFGACITSQLGSIHPKMRAVSALVRLRGGSGKLRQELASFCGSLYTLAEERARAVHDPRFMNERTKEVARWQTTATAKEIVFGPQPESVESLEAITERISVRIRVLMKLREKINAELLAPGKRPPVQLLRIEVPKSLPENPTKK